MPPTTSSRVWEIPVAARFASVPAAPTLPAQVRPADRTIKCGSRFGGEHECETGGNAASVSLIREKSTKKCKRNDTWGYTDIHVRARNGCEGEFEVSYGGGAVTLPGTGSNIRTVSCGNVAGPQVECRTGGYATAVRVVRDRGPTRCRQGENWGHPDSFIWANRGCVGLSEVTYRRTERPR